MTPAKQTGLWLVYFCSFLLIFSAFYLFLPEVYLFRRFRELVGFITEQAWNDLFMLAILGASVIINTLLIYTVATLRNRQA